MKYFGYTLLLIILFSLKSRAGCLPNLADPYDLNLPMVKGPNAGKCIDTKMRRPARIIKSSNTHIWVANFYHKNKWWIAKIPRSGPDAVIFQTATFKTSIPFMVAAHTQLRFVFSNENHIELVSQATDSPEEFDRVSGMIYSVEYIAPENVKYDVISGQFDSVGIVSRILSIDQRAAEQANDPEVIAIDQEILNLTQQNRADLVDLMLSASQAMGIQQMYNTIRRNCTNELFKLLDMVVAYKVKVLEYKTSPLHFMDPVAGPAKKALMNRHLLSPGGQLQDFKKEYILQKQSISQLSCDTLFI